MVHIVEKLAVNISVGADFIAEDILSMLPQSKKVVQCNSRKVSVLAPKIRDTGVNVSMANASEASPATLSATRTQAKRSLSKKNWLAPKDS